MYSTSPAAAAAAAYWGIILLLDLPQLWGWGGLRVSEDAEQDIDTAQFNIAPVEHIITLQGGDNTADSDALEEAVENAAASYDATGPGPTAEDAPPHLTLAAADSSGGLSAASSAPPSPEMRRASSSFEFTEDGRLVRAQSDGSGGSQPSSAPPAVVAAQLRPRRQQAARQTFRVALTPGAGFRSGSAAVRRQIVALPPIPEATMLRVPTSEAITSGGAGGATSAAPDAVMLDMGYGARGDRSRMSDGRTTASSRGSSVARASVASRASAASAIGRVLGGDAARGSPPVTFGRLVAYESVDEGGGGGDDRHMDDFVEDDNSGASAAPSQIARVASHGSVVGSAAGSSSGDVGWDLSSQDSPYPARPRDGPQPTPLLLTQATSSAPPQPAPPGP